MEMTAALRLWKRSTEAGFRYTTLLSDGDSKTFFHLQNNKVYGDTSLRKQECINHLQKRVGTALRNLVKDVKKGEGTQLGGRLYGSLTNEKIDKIGRYYRNALLNNRGEKEKMKLAVYAILDHCRSSDDRPLHKKCPTGVESWCFFNRALAMQTLQAGLENILY